ncbi:hypothetical protein U1Q18_042872 [Sarracenia purpurea var. burkii]
MPPAGLGPAKAGNSGLKSIERRIVPAQSLLILRRSGDAPRKHLCVFPLSSSVEFQVSEIVRELGWFSASPSHQERGKGRPERTWLLGSTPGHSVEAALLLGRVGSTRLSGRAAQCAACPASVGLIGPASVELFSKGREY